MHFIIERGGSVKVPAIAEPKLKAKKYIEFFKAALDHEKFISESIGKLADLAIEINDHASKSLLQWFVDEQVEEEGSVEKIIAYLEMIGDNSGAIFMLNAELGKR
jgi:ferritin